MRLNIYFKCAQCHGTGQVTPTSSCPACKGTGIVLKQFKDVIKVIEFPDARPYESTSEVQHG